MIRLTVNGEIVEMEKPTPLVEYLEKLGVNTQRVAVAVNMSIIQRGRYGEVTLKDGDAVEIVRPVGGG
jgi:thiamine biosynthesis protein ThiS